MEVSISNCYIGANQALLSKVDSNGRTDRAPAHGRIIINEDFGVWAKRAQHYGVIYAQGCKAAVRTKNHPVPKYYSRIFFHSYNRHAIKATSNTQLNTV